MPAGNGVEVAKAFVTVIPTMQSAQTAITSAMVPGANAAGLMAGKKAGGSMLSTFTGFASKAAAAFGAVGLAVGVASFIKSTVRAGAEFDTAMSQVAATMGTTVDQIGVLRDFAQEMGSKTAFSATQAAEALNYMALAGYDAQTSMDMLPTVLNLAAAGAMDLAAASDMVTDTQSALGLTIEETTELVDKMAAAASTTNTSVAQLGDAMLTIGGTAKDMAGGTTELAGALGILADNGIKGAEGGTALRNIMSSFASGKFEKAFGDLGVAAYDAEGNMRPLQDIVTDMNTVMADMSTADRSNLISKAFNVRDLKSVNALLGTDAERWEEVYAAIDDSAGAAERMAETQLDNLEGDVTLFKSALEGAQIALSDLFKPMMRPVVQLGSVFFSGLTDFLHSEELANFGAGMAERIAPAGQAIQNMFTGITQSGTAQRLMESLGSALSTIGNVIASIITPAIQILAPIAGLLFDLVSFNLSFIFSLLTTVGQAILTSVMPYVQQLADFLQPHLEKLKQWFEQNLPAMQETVGAVLSGIGSVLRVVLPWTVSFITGAIDTIKRVVSTVRTIIGVVQRVFNAVKAAITNPIETAKNVIRSIIEKIKGFFSFSVPTPHIPLPHFSISPSGWKVGDLLKGSIPTLGIEWYAKGGIFTAPSIIGVGEAGAEAVLPLSRLDAMLDGDDGGDTFNLYINGTQMMSDEAIETRFYSLMDGLLTRYRLMRGH